MDDSFSCPIPFPGGSQTGLPRMPQITLDASALAGLVADLSCPGQALSLLTVFGKVLHDPRAPLNSDWSATWPDGSAALIDGAVAYARGGRDVMFEAMAPSAQSPQRLSWWRVHLTPVLTEDGGAIQFLMAQATDISGQMDQKHRNARADWLPRVSVPGPLTDSG